MKSHHPILTGPAAAGLYGLDGFRDRLWPQRFTSKRNGSRTDVLQTRIWLPHQMIGETPVAAMALVCRQLNSYPQDLLRLDDLSPLDRVELAVEHARRLGHVVEAAKGGCQPGDVLLRLVRCLSGNEPPTESYAETIGLQTLRSWGFSPWRQVLVTLDKPRRVDFVIPFRKGHRPSLLRPSHGMVIEIDSKEFHADRFEEDHARWAALDRAEFHWMSITPNQITRSPQKVLAAIQGVLRRARLSGAYGDQHGSYS